MARTKCCGILFIGQASYINRETYYVLLANYTILYVSAIFISRQRLSPKYHTTVPGTFTSGDPNSLRLQRIHIDSKVVERSSMYCKVMKLCHFLPEASYGLRVLSLPACVCVCVCLSVNHQLVRAITNQLFKLESPNLDQRCKRPWLRSLLFLGAIDLELQGQIELKSPNLPHFELVRAISHHQLKSVFSNFGKKCILALLRSLLNLGWIDLDVLFHF